MPNPSSPHLIPICQPHSPFLLSSEVLRPMAPPSWRLPSPSRQLPTAPIPAPPLGEEETWRRAGAAPRRVPLPCTTAAPSPSRRWNCSTAARAPNYDAPSLFL